MRNLSDKKKIEALRNVLHNEITKGFNKKRILEISRILDRYIVEYIEKHNKNKTDKDNKKR